MFCYCAPSSVHQLIPRTEGGFGRGRHIIFGVLAGLALRNNVVFDTRVESERKQTCVSRDIRVEMGAEAISTQTTSSSVILPGLYRTFASVQIDRRRSLGSL